MHACDGAMKSSSPVSCNPAENAIPACSLKGSERKLHDVRLQQRVALLQFKNGMSLRKKKLLKKETFFHRLDLRPPNFEMSLDKRVHKLKVCIY